MEKSSRLETRLSRAKAVAAFPVLVDAEEGKAHALPTLSLSELELDALAPARAGTLNSCTCALLQAVVDL